MSYATALDRDFDRLVQYKNRTNICPLGWFNSILSFISYKIIKFFVLPLGSGAIAGNPFEIDRDNLALNLNFHHASFNSIDSTANRDFICKFL